jgi:hypothetical protein
MKMKIPEGPFALSCLLVAIFFAQNAFGTFTDATLISSLYDVPFSITAGDGKVDCEVYQHDITDEYLYTYQISNLSSSAPFSFFSVGITDELSAYDPAYDIDPFSSDINPIFYTASSDPVQSIDYMFSNTIGIGQQSSVLFFKSVDAPGLGKATLYSSNMSSTNDVLTPVPEPATIALFGSAGLLILRRQGKELNKKSCLQKQGKY